MPTYANVIPAPPVGGSYQGAPASMGVNHLIPAVANMCIGVVSYTLQSAGTATVQFQDTAAVALAPAWSFQAREGVRESAPPNFYLFITAPGVGLDLNLSAGVAVNCDVQYVYMAG